MCWPSNKILEEPPARGSYTHHIEMCQRALLVVVDADDCQTPCFCVNIPVPLPRKRYGYESFHAWGSLIIKPSSLLVETLVNQHCKKGYAILCRATCKIHYKWWWIIILRQQWYSIVFKALLLLRLCDLVYLGRLQLLFPMWYFILLVAAWRPMCKASMH